MSIHQVWKINYWNLSNTIYFGFLDLIEFAVWIGIPLFSLAIKYIIRSWVQIKSLAANQSHLFAISFIIAFFLMAFLGKTVAETGRLWIFIVPIFVLLASLELKELFEKHWNFGLNVIVVVQLFNTYFFKLYQDFR